MNGYGLGSRGWRMLFYAAAFATGNEPHAVLNITLASMKKDLGEDRAKLSNGRMEIPPSQGKASNRCGFATR
jgi:hypothetical protein